MATIPSLVVAANVIPTTSAIAAMPDVSGQSISVQILYGVGVLIGAAVGSAWLFWKNFKTPPAKPAGLVLDTAELADLRPFYEMSRHAAECAKYLRELNDKFDDFIENQKITVKILQAREHREEVRIEAEKLMADRLREIQQDQGARDRPVSRR